MKIYLLFDEVLKYALEDERDRFKEMNVATQVGCIEGDSIIWEISQHDELIAQIEIKNRPRKPGKPPKGSWKDSWIEPPTNINDRKCEGKPNGAGSTKEDPFHFAYDIRYKLKNSPRWNNLDPDIVIPPQGLGGG